MKAKKYPIHFLSVIIISNLSFIIFSCSTTEPPPPVKSISLAQNDTMLTEISLTIKLNNISTPAEVTLLRDNTPLLNFLMSRADTTVTDTTAEPNKSYKYKAAAKTGGETFTSGEFTAVTMDTTTQNFTFEYFEYGDGWETAYLNDVWVFDENNIWAVGYLGWQDSIGNPNIIRWNGNKWYLPKYNGNSSGMYGIWANDTEHIYFATGAIHKYINGIFSAEDLTHLPWQNGQAVHKLWGSSLSNIWGVGPGGTIVHYNGVKWEKIDFDTQWWFYEITGNTETDIAYAVSCTIYDAIVVKLENSTAEIIYQKSQRDTDIGAWTLTITENNGYCYLASSSLPKTAIWRINEKDYSVKEIAKIDPRIGIYQSSAREMNDMYFVGNDWTIGKLIHFNGIRFSIFDLQQQLDNYGGCYSLKDFTVIVGRSNNKAFIVKIRRI